MFKWSEMDYFKTGEWQVIQERLDDMDKSRTLYCPRYKDMFKALKVTPFEKVKVAIIGQDPYPNPELATGIAFSIPPESNVWPATLKNIIQEYDSDLKYGWPEHGSLIKWCEQGVLLWNSIPSCTAWQPASHRHWPEWQPLTQEIIERLSPNKIVFVLLGSVAHSYAKYVDESYNSLLRIAHPSPRAGKWKAKTPFIGSRMFSTVNAELVRLCHDPVDWRLE